jgi:hypothetical protein
LGPVAFDWLAGTKRWYRPVVPRVRTQVKLTIAATAAAAEERAGQGAPAAAFTLRPDRHVIEDGRLIGDDQIIHSLG